MSGKIFRGIIFVTLAAMLVTAAAVFATAYGKFLDMTENELERSALLAAEGVELHGIEYLDATDADGMGAALFSDGDLVYRTENVYIPPDDFTNMNGFSVHGFGANLENAAIYSLTLESGNILCITESIASPLSFFLSISTPLLIIFAAVLTAAGICASRISAAIVRPICDIDFSRPETLAEYSELAPVAKRLSEQNSLLHRKAEEEQLRKSEFTAITDNMSEGMLVIGEGAEILSYNKSAEKMLGLTETMPRYVTALGISPELLGAVADALSGRKRIETLRSNGRYYSVIINPVIHENSVQGAVVVILDETEKEQREALRREFTSNISHELKTPLTSISGFAELIMNGMCDGDEKHFAGNIYKEAQRLIILVGDIIKLNRLDSGEIPFDSEPFDLYEICSTVTERLSNVAAKAGVALTLEGENILISGTARVIEEMIYNLADNAIKYNNDGGFVKLSVRYDNETKKALVACRDNGIGIPEEHKARIFERFYRVDKSRSKSIGGTGLGLSIVKHGANRHGAQISLDSREGEGTTVTLAFPTS